MIVIASLLLGAALGALRARRGGGNVKDVAQYAAVFAVIGAILGLFLTVLIDRMV